MEEEEEIIITTSAAAAAAAAAGASSSSSSEGATVSGRLGLETLPDLVLLMIFEMLPLSDRAYLGSVCKRFDALMYSPSLWRNISLRTTLQDGFSVSYGFVEAAGLCQNDEFMIKKFDKYLQNVSVYINSGFLKVSLFQTLSELARKRTLKRLVFLGAETVQERKPLITPSLLVVNDLLVTKTDFLDMLKPETTAIKMHLALLDDDGEGGKKYEPPSKNPLATKFRHLLTEEEEEEEEEEEMIITTSAAAATASGRLGLETLPDLVLLMIFEMLPLSDRAYLGSVCKRFDALMYSPSLWRNISLRTTLQDGFSVSYGFVEAAGLCQNDEFMIKKFDKYLQNVSVYINSGFLKVSLLHTLRELARKRTLKRLVFLEAETVQGRKPLITTPLFSVNDLLATVTDFLDMLDPVTTAIKMHLVFLHDDGGGRGGEKYELPSENPSATPTALFFQDEFFLDNCMLLP